MTQERKVDFIVIGAAKSGTTTLHGYLSKHPKIFMPELKEPCYFDNTMKDGIDPSKGWHLGEAWYHSLFADANEDQLLGEASTNYTRYPQVMDTPKRIFEYNPQVKLIYVLRDPVARTYSHYVHRCVRELQLDPPFARGIKEQVVQDPMCIDSSKYAMQLDQYYEYFEHDSVLLVSFSELISQPEAVVNKVLDFLALEHDPEILKSSLVLNNAARVLSDKRFGVVQNRYKSIPLLKAIATLVPGTSIRRLFYSVVEKLPSNKKLMGQFEPPTLTDEDASHIRDLLRSDMNSLKEKYHFTDEDWMK